MLEPNIENYIIKFITKSATKDELDALNVWIKQPSNQSVFKDYIALNYGITLAFLSSDITEIRNHLFNQIKADKQKTAIKRLTAIIKYAAVLLLFVSLGFILKDKFLPSPPVASLLVPKHDDIVLTLSDGTTQIIDENSSEIIEDLPNKTHITHHHTNLEYTSDTIRKHIGYHTLTVPYGKRINIVLADGTEVAMNSGSSIYYPTAFNSNQPRIVHLTGEAFFNVSKRKTQPFFVETQNVNVKVLGTQFNVTSYPDDTYAQVALVEGSVGLNLGDNTKTEDHILKPGTLGTYDKNQQYVNTKINTLIYTSWVSGKLIFREAPFDSILEKLERSFNITIINNNKTIGAETFNATINLNKETIDDVLQYFTEIYDIKYQIVNNKLIIQ